MINWFSKQTEPSCCVQWKFHDGASESDDLTGKEASKATWLWPALDSESEFRINSDTKDFGLENSELIKCIGGHLLNSEDFQSRNFQLNGNEMNRNGNETNRKELKGSD